jgi:di/tricarboxylate transporter
MADNVVLNAKSAFWAQFRLDSKVLWLSFASLIGLVVWFMPVMPGLTLTGQHALAVVLFTVLLWISNAAPTGVSSLLMIGIVLCFMPEIKPSVFLGFWTGDTMWFILVCFLFSAVVETSGLGKRLTVYVFSIRSLILIDLGLLGLNALFSALGMNASFPKLALLFPLITTLATMSSMPKDDPYVRHLAIMINVLANTTGTLVYSGFVINPALGPLGGFEVNYVTWLEWFFVPALVYTMVSFVVIYFLFLPPRDEHFDAKVEEEELKKLGPLSAKEIKAIAWLTLAIVLWATGPLTGIPTGFAAALVAAMMLLPGIGMLTFKEYVQKTDWNAVFMLMGILAIGTLGVTGFASWIWAHILPAQMPHNPMVSLTIISALVEVLHIPLGSTATSQALAVPSLADYATTLGMSRILVSFVTYMSIVGQFFFTYQNAALVVGLGYGLWRPMDIFKYGVVMFFLTPITLGVLLYPWWVYMGWIG